MTFPNHFTKNTWSSMEAVITVLQYYIVRGQWTIVYFDKAINEVVRQCCEQSGVN